MPEVASKPKPSWALNAQILAEYVGSNPRGAFPIQVRNAMVGLDGFLTSAFREADEDRGMARTELIKSAIARLPASDCEGGVDGTIIDQRLLIRDMFKSGQLDSSKGKRERLKRFLEALAQQAQP